MPSVARTSISTSGAFGTCPTAVRIGRASGATTARAEMASTLSAASATLGPDSSTDLAREDLVGEDLAREDLAPEDVARAILPVQIWPEYRVSRCTDKIVCATEET